jgi:hypothetical protein
LLSCLCLLVYFITLSHFFSAASASPSLYLDAAISLGSELKQALLMILYLLVGFNFEGRVCFGLFPLVLAGPNGKEDAIVNMLALFTCDAVS